MARWQARLAGLVWNDAALEGNPFTLPDVQTLLDGGAVKGYDNQSHDQILDLSEAAKLVEDTASLGPTPITGDLSDRLNGLITAHEVMEPGVLRGEGTVGGEAAVSIAGGRFIALPTVDGGRELRRIFNESAQQANQISHPVAAAVTWAALAAYHQFYGNGNKRTARYMMNIVMLSNGFDAIVTPAAKRDQYNDALHDMYVSGDVTGFALFMASLYDDAGGTGHMARALGQTGGGPC